MCTKIYSITNHICFEYYIHPILITVSEQQKQHMSTLNCTTNTGSAKKYIQLSHLPEPMASRANLWQVYPKWHVAFNAVPVLLHIFCPTIICVYIHIPDCTETVHELLLLPNNITCGSLLHKSEVVCSVDWIFITGARDWVNVTSGKTFYNPCNKLQIQVSK